ncbi:MAG: hypothetical protein LH630_06410 [Actinomycetia bacterium]|nr:hypothetical protein [Actinomycetes bacterium]
MTTIDTEALAQLWSTDDLRADHVSAAEGRTFLVLPSIDRPRLVVPTRPHRAAGAIVRALRDKSSTKARAKTLAIRTALATGAKGTWLPDPDLFGEVIRQLPQEEYVYGVHLGPPRANRKPVLVLATAQGGLVAFVKCGVNALTDQLVHAEAAALTSVAHLTSLRTPHLIGMGEHRDHPYTVQSPVPTNRHRRSAAHIVAAQVEVASVGRGSIDVTAELDAVAERWRQRVIAAADGQPGVKEFAGLAERWTERAHGSSLNWGSWHGDWRRTNMAVTSSGCSVWDWERFATGVPVGYDALHLFLMSHASSVHDLSSLPVDLFDNAQRLLRPFGVRGRTEAELTTAGYLLELSGRYIDDNQSQTGVRLGPVHEWLLPFLSTTLMHQVQHGAGRPGSGVSEP